MTRQPVKKKKKVLVWCTAGTLLFICLTCLAGVYLLKSGITVERFNIGPVTVSDSTLVWNDRLELQVGTLTVKEDHEPSTAIISRERASRAVRAADYILRLFSKINIRSVKIGQHDLFFDLLRKNADSFLLNLATETTKLTVSLEVDQHKLRAEIRSFSDSRIDLELYGAVQLDAAEAIASGTLNVDIEKSFPVRLSFSSDGNTVSFRGAEAGIIADIKPFVDLFGLEDNVQKWITDYLDAERYRLLSFSGEYVFGEPMSLFHSLEAEIMVDDASYIFEPDLEPIYDDHPRAFFNNGILDIRPNNPRFYGHDGGSSRLDIDFNDPENFMLNVYINAETMADEAILDLLRYYSIDLPLVQVDGTTRADLRLSINLQTEDVSGEGLFFIDDGIIIYDGAEFSLTDSRFSLKDSEVHLEHLELSYDDIFVATVSGWIFADRDVWDLDIDLDKLEFNLGESTIRLDNSVLKPEIAYHVSVDGHFLEAGESSWMLDSTAVRLGPFRAPVNLDDLSTRISAVSVAMPPGIHAEVSGTFSIKKKSADFTCDLQKYHVKDLKLEQPEIPFRVRYLDRLIITTKETAQWSLGSVPVTFYPSEVVYADNLLTFVSGSLSYGNFFNSSFTGDFNTLTREGSLYLSKIDITHNRLDTQIDVGERTLVEVTEKEGTFVIDFTEFGLKITSDAQRNWSAEFADLSKIYPRSELLRTFKIASGTVTISSVNGTMPYELTADIAAPYALLVADGSISDRLAVTGTLSQSGLSATVNSNVALHYFEDTLDIKSQDVGYNIKAIKELMADISRLTKDAEDETEEQFKMNLQAENSYFYLTPESRIVADSIQVHYLDSELSMELRHGGGLLQLERVGGIYFVNAENLNDVFMEALLQGAYIEGGSLALAGMGSDDEMSAVIEIRDTVMKDLKTLNNTMTLLNTLPALVTFSIPEYETDGLPVRSAIIGLKYSDNKAVFKSIEVDSSVVQAAGKGWIDMSDRTIDMDIQLTSQAGRNIRKIPIVGYVIAGKKEDTSVTLKIAGDLDNPEVSNSILQEIVTMPIDMLYRTLNLPFHLVNKLGPFTDNDSNALPLESEKEFPESDK